MGEGKQPSKTALALAGEEALVVQTMGGRMHLRWDETARATPHGQLLFFAEFLATAGVFDRWVEECPLQYSSPNASSKRDVLGRLMLGILSGSKRYAHIAGIRGDAVAAQALGMHSVVSEDSVRRALKAMELAPSEHWMRQSLMTSVRDSLNRPCGTCGAERAAPPRSCRQAAETMAPILAHLQSPCGLLAMRQARTKPSLRASGPQIVGCSTYLPLCSLISRG